MSLSLSSSPYFFFQKLSSLLTKNALEICIRRTSLFMRKPGRPFLIHPSVQTSLTQNCQTITGFSYNLLPVSCGDTGFLIISIGQVLAWKPGLTVLLLRLRPSGPLQTIQNFTTLHCAGLMRVLSFLYFYLIFLQPPSCFLR